MKTVEAFKQVVKDIFRLVCVAAYFSDGVKVQGDFHFGTNIGGRIDAY